MPAERVESGATARPWEVDRRCSTHVMESATDRGICTTGGYQTNAIPADLLLAENEANARLIVEAVNAHDALVDALRRIVWLYESGPCDATDLYREARAALASLPTNTTEDSSDG